MDIYSLPGRSHEPESSTGGQGLATTAGSSALGSLDAIAPLGQDRKKCGQPSPLDFTDPNKSTEYDEHETNSTIPVIAAFSTARHIEPLERIEYPEGISTPDPALVETVDPRCFRYDRAFLLQFREVCKGRPPSMASFETLTTLGLQRHERYASGRRPQKAASPTQQSGRHRGASGAPFGGPSTLGKPGNGFSGGMGSFMLPGRMSSEDRFAMSNAGSWSASVGGAGMPLGPPTATMELTASQGGQTNKRTRTKRGGRRPPKDGKGKDQHSSPQQQQMVSLEPVAPLQATENRWDRKSFAKATGADPRLIVDRKVKGLLNKLTMEKFELISNQIIEWANKSEADNGQTLTQVICLVFEKAIDDPHMWCEMYARLCRKMMQQISPKVQDNGIRNAKGKPIAGGQLFRKYLLNRCQEDFERGWVNEKTAAGAVTVSSTSKEATKKQEEIAPYSDEYYAAQKVKRQGLGIVKFMGELFKLQMLTERIMHECVKKLLSNLHGRQEEDIESLCTLLTTVGALLDTPKARAHMDIYFSRLKELSESPDLRPRLQFMLQDVIELRDRKWKIRGGTIAVAAPMTIAQVHEAAAKEKAARR